MKDLAKEQAKDQENYSLVMENNQSTVIAEYIPSKRDDKSYQSEAELEAEFIKNLQNNGYEYVSIKNNNALLANVREQLSKLNNYNFSDIEWSIFCREYLCNKGDGIEQKTIKIHENDRYVLKKEDGSTQNIEIISKSAIHKNTLQVISQYEAEGNYKNRYDVTILVNGIPLCHVELKRRGVVLHEAFKQIDRYQEDSFWADSGLFNFVQLYVISNGTHTKYYSNTTRGNKTAFNFTSWWTDAQNNRIKDLNDFTKTFFSKHTLLSVITKYCIFTSEKELKAMRPYQIVASECIINKIAMAKNTKVLGSIDAGGYIWHTTGSGKTLTSFKTAQLATKLDYVDKVLFVVDRKDLDSQTIREYQNFDAESVKENVNSRVLKGQLLDKSVKIVVTTIQKLDRFINSNKGEELFNKHVVIIFDECHRSQFGSMNVKIKKAFKKYNMFGFTGTPIFNDNANGAKNSFLQTTEQAFGKQLHSYTIVDAINDENVLPFKVDFVNTLYAGENIEDKKVNSIDSEKVLLDPKRIKNVTEYILKHFDQKTIKSKGGFNSMFAVASIDMAKLYYKEFAKQQESIAPSKRLKVALIYSFGANDAEQENGILSEEELDISGMDSTNRDFLENVIKDYNSMFGGTFDTSSDGFQRYYTNLSERVKDREIDILIVVNMFLTGFDAKTLNTLWVDKNLRYHGLLQAFSRTNRTLNTVKQSGNIVCFRDLEQNAKDAISLFGNKEASGLVFLPTYEEYYNGYEKDGVAQKGYLELIAELQSKFSLPVELIGEQQTKEFISLYGSILRLTNIMSCFDSFEGKEILTKRDFQDYQSSYLDLREKMVSETSSDKEVINDDVVFEMELVKQVDINIDYILMLVADYQKSKMQDKEVLTSIQKTLSSSVDLRSKKDLIEKFINTLNLDTNIEVEWREFTNKNYEEDLNKIIEEEKLKPELARNFMQKAFRDKELKLIGIEFSRIIPAVNLLDKNNTALKKHNIVKFKLIKFFEKHFGA